MIRETQRVKEMERERESGREGSRQRQVRKGEKRRERDGD